jgi:hypothetical protein
MSHSRPAPTDRRELWLSVTAEFEKTLAEKVGRGEFMGDAGAKKTGGATEPLAGHEFASGKLCYRAARFFQWFIPTALLAVMPKCPMCLAAYLALFTGTGVSFTAASHLRTGLIAVCIITLFLLLARLIHRNLTTQTSTAA